MMTVITRVNKLFLSLAQDVSHNHLLLLFFFILHWFLRSVAYRWIIRWLCGYNLWAGKTHVRCVHVYITISERNKVSDKTLTAKRIQTILDFPFHKNEKQFDVKILLNSLL